jgi:hypothetical protein
MRTRCLLGHRGPCEPMGKTHLEVPARARRKLLLRQRAQHAGPVPGQHEHGHWIKIDAATVQISRLPATVNPGAYPKPIPFDGMCKPANHNSG